MSGNQLKPKVYIDRETGETHTSLIRRLSSSLRRSFRQVTDAITRPLTRRSPPSSYRSLTNEDVPEVKAEKMFSPILLLGFFSIAFGQFSIMSTEDYDRLFKFISDYELVDFVVDDLSHRFPELRLRNNDMKTLLKREITDFLYDTTKETEDLKKQLNEFLSGSPSNFIVLPTQFKKFKRLVRKLYSSMNEKHRDVIQNETDMMWFLVGTSLYRLLDAKDEKYKGKTEKEIRRDVDSTRRQLMDDFFGSYPKRDHVTVRRKKLARDEF